MRILLLFIFCFSSTAIYAQKSSYLNSIKEYRKNYVEEHEVVKGDERKYFTFFKINDEYYVSATFEKITDTLGFLMKTSGTKTPRYYRYGYVTFNLRGQELKLTLFQNKDLAATAEYKNYLFLPFTDRTSGTESYGGGRYIDLDLTDIINGRINIDFNKAYNPYCAYATGYNCPLPMRENDLSIAIKAGEKMFRKK